MWANSLIPERKAQMLDGQFTVHSSHGLLPEVKHAAILTHILSFEH